MSVTRGNATKRQTRRATRALRLVPLLMATMGALGLIAFGCLPGSGPALTDGIDATPPPLTGLDDASAQRADVDLGDPFALIGLTPSHGPFTGGTRTILSGRGFSTKIRVFFGTTQVDPSNVLANDPQHAAVVTPPSPNGASGPISVRIVDDVTKKERTLASAFTYDSLVVTPPSGATSGGTRIEVTGQGTHFAAGATVKVGALDCGTVSVTDATHLQCVTPASAGPGIADITVTLADKSTVQARDAFTYSDAPDGNRGGLAGGVLNGRITVVAIDSYTGTPIPGAKVVLGTDAANPLSTSKSGVAQKDDPGLVGKITVTVGAKCHQPTTFVDVPVDTVTVYLAPVLDLSCASGDPPSVGGGGGHNGGGIAGELIFPGGVEFRRGNWQNVPPPATPTERNAAYVFQASGSPTESFQLPPVDLAITTDSPGARGYAFSAFVYPGNVTLYALAGIEDRSFSPPRFTAYVMGVARGLYVPQDTELTSVNISMTTLLDHAVTLTAAAPLPGPRGPDRLVSNVAVTLGSGGFAIIPGAAKVSPLPLSGPIGILGIPSLDQGLLGESYVISAQAGTGPDFLAPASVISRVKTTAASGPVSLGGFLAVPVLSEPSAAPWGGTHVTFSGPPTFDVSVTSVSSDKVTWSIFGPPSTTAFDLPDLTQVPSTDPIGLRRGAITTSVYTARVDAFSYSTVRYGQLGTGAWNAYSVDARPGVY
jgi:hypothetical protein